MSVIISSAWKGKKEGTVIYKGEEYVIGSSAFGSVEDAVNAGYNSDFVVLDKKLTSPVKDADKELVYITDAATDIFTSTENTVESPDGKTETKTISFNAAAAGTASIKDEDSVLTGFDSVTANKAGGSFFGGRVIASENKKTVEDYDKYYDSTDITASVTTSASGSLSVTGDKEDFAQVAAVGAIADSVGGLDTVAGDITDIYGKITGIEADDINIGASYANVTVKYVEFNSDEDVDINGGVVSVAATESEYTNEANGKIENNKYSFTYTEKTGAGTADLKDVTGLNDIIGFGSVKISNTGVNDNVEVDDVKGGSKTESYSLTTTFTEDVSSSYNYSFSRATGLAGSLNATGKNDNAVVTIDNVNHLNSINAKYAVIGEQGNEDAICAFSDSEQASIAISVRKQGENDSLTATVSKTESEVAGGSLTASNSAIIAEDGYPAINGVANVSLTASSFTSADATNLRYTGTKTETGFAVAGISDDQKNDYADVFFTLDGDVAVYNVLDTTLVEESEAYTLNYSSRRDYSVGGAKFAVSGKSAGDATVIKGYSNVSLDNKDSENALTVYAITNQTSSRVASARESFVPESSFSYTETLNYTDSAVGTATIKGNTTAGFGTTETIPGTLVTKGSGFASVKATGSKYETKLTGVAGEKIDSWASTETRTVSATPADPRGTYSETLAFTARTATTLDASKAELSGDYTDLKSVKLQNVKADSITFANTYGDKVKRESKTVTWNADDITKIEAFNDPMTMTDERVITWNYSKDETMTMVGDFSLKNTDANADVEEIGITNFRNVDITLAAKDAATAVLEVEFNQEGDSTVRSSVAQAVSETRRTNNSTYASTSTAVGSLKITGKSTKEGATTISAGGDINFANITLKDVQVVGGVSASAYSSSFSTTAAESATLDAGDVAAVTYTFSQTYTQTGIGKFTASVSKVPDAGALTVFAGELKGYGTISLSNVNIGSVDNYKTVGGYYAPAYVPWDGEYEDMTLLTGNVTGSYTMAANGQINAKWTATSSKTASGSFTQEGAKVAVTAGSIDGYDKVTLTAAAVLGHIEGSSSEGTIVLTYTTDANGDAIVDTEVDTTKKTSGSSVKLAGKKIGSDMVSASAEKINGYQNVTLQNAQVADEIAAVNSQEVLTIDKLNEESTDDSFFAIQETTKTAVGSMTATDSLIGGEIKGYQTVKLTNTNASVVYGGSSANTVEGVFDGDFTPAKTISAQETAVGSFTAEVTSKDLTGAEVTVVSGFQKVSVTDYNVGFAMENAINYSSETIVATANSLKVTPGNEDKEIPETWQMAGSTKSNSFSATAKKNDDMSVNMVRGFGKVEATALKTVGPVTNFYIQDDIDPEAVFYTMESKDAYQGRKYNAVHYGDWTATYQADDEIFTAISADATSASVKINGKAAVKNKSEAVPTAVYNILGYGNVTLNLVDISGAESFAGGKFAYTTKTNADDEFIATSKSEAAGKLTISNTTDDDAAFAVEGFKDVDIKLAGGATISSIVGGTEFAQFTDGDLDYTTYAVSGKLNLVTVEGTVEGLVAGFDKVSFTDTGLGADAEIQGYAVDAKFVDDEWVQTVSGKSTITFDNTVEGSTEIAGTITNAKAIEFKTSKADADTTDFVVTGTINSQKADEEAPFVNTKITVTKCEAEIDFQNFLLDKGDVVELKSGAVIALSNLEDGSVAGITEYFQNMIDAEISGKGTLTAAITEDDWNAFLEADVMKIGKGVTFVSSNQE